MNEVVDRSTLIVSAASARAMPPVRPEIQDAARNAVFAILVNGDNDIVGLVAYSIFKRNELDWRAAFNSAEGRAPSAVEAGAYIIGESTPRRVATYRYLADATLAGGGPDAGSSAASTGGILAIRQDAKPAGRSNVSTLASVVIALVVLAGAYLAASYGIAR